KSNTITNRFSLVVHPAAVASSVITMSRMLWVRITCKSPAGAGAVVVTTPTVASASVAKERRVTSILLLLAVGLVERRFQAAGERGHIVGRPEMHVEEPRRVLEPVIVERRHIDAMLPEGAGDGVHFLVDEHEIAGDR